MKGLAKGLVFGSALFVLASATTVKAGGEIKLHCDEPECTEPISIDPNDGYTYIAWCDDGYAATNMVCHKAKGITCEKAVYKNSQWECVCDNWDFKTRDTTIDIWCAGESE